jgi:hypothetical protein
MLCTAVLIGFFSAAAFAQDETTHITLGTVSGLPKAEVLIPVMLTPFPSDLKVGEIKASISFDTQSVTFLRAEKSFLLDGVGAGFQSEQHPDPSKPGRTIVDITVATKGSPRLALREGLVLTLLFRINENAAAGSTIEVAVVNPSASDLSDPPQPIKPVTGKNGGIEVIAPEQNPYVPCFFFTH